MSERDLLVQSIIAAAVAAAGPRPQNDGAWKGKINANIPAIAAMMEEQSRQWRSAVEVLDAQVFTAIYRGHELEASSTRNVVTLETSVSKSYPDGLEPIRTHRTDNAAGKRMAAALEQLTPGDEIVVWKAMETSATDPNLKVRILVHFETRPKFTSAGASAAPAQRGPAPEVPIPPGPDDSSRQGPVHTSAGTQADALMQQRFDALPPKIKVAVVKRARAAGISIPPSDEQIDRFIIIIQEEEGA